MARKNISSGSDSSGGDEVIGYIEPIEINLEMERSLF